MTHHPQVKKNLVSVCVGGESFLQKSKLNGRFSNFIQKITYEILSVPKISFFVCHSFEILKKADLSKKICRLFLNFF
jgi:hypothetical protein